MDPKDGSTRSLNTRIMLETEESYVSVGMDLGTTNSCVCVCTALPRDPNKPSPKYPMDYNITMQVLINNEDQHVTPSCVYFYPDGPHTVGHSAMKEAEHNRANLKNVRICV